MIMLDWILHFCPEAGNIVIGAPSFFTSREWRWMLAFQSKGQRNGEGNQEGAGNFSGDSESGAHLNSTSESWLSYFARDD